MTQPPANQAIRWSFERSNPVVRPGQIHGELDARRAGAAHVLRFGERYRMYYWATGGDGLNRICCAESDATNPNDWRPLGCCLEPQPNTEYNRNGPSFPFVLPADDAPWLMFFGAWGQARAEGQLPNTTGVAVSHDGGRSWRYGADRPVLALDRPYDHEGTGSCCVLRVGGELRMYYTAIGSYFRRPEGVRTGHGDLIPRIGIAYAVLRDGLGWEKPLPELMISPRGLGADPYEYICSKPFVVRGPGGYRMWVSTFGPAYRIRSLTSPDGLNWAWRPSGPDGDLGVGEPGRFDDRHRCYAGVVPDGGRYLCWYTGNGFGTSGIGFATGAAEEE